MVDLEKKLYGKKGFDPNNKKDVKKMLDHMEIKTASSFWGGFEKQAMEENQNRKDKIYKATGKGALVGGAVGAGLGAAMMGWLYGGKRGWREALKVLPLAAAGGALQGAGPGAAVGAAKGTYDALTHKSKNKK